MAAIAEKPNVRFRRLRISSSRMTEARFAYLLVLPVVIVLLAIMLYPTLYSLWVSFFNVDVASNTWDWVGLGNYVDALTSPEVQGAIWTTVRYTILVTVFSGVVAVAGALLINERFRGRGALSMLIILPWSLSTYAAGVIFRFLYLPSGFINSALQQLHIIQQPVQFISESMVLVSIAIAQTWQVSPLGILFVYATLQVIPEDLFRLGRTDGLNAFARFRNVIWPYIRLPIAIYLVLVTSEAAKVFDIIFFMSGGGPGTASLDLVYDIYKQTFVNYELGLGAAISYILVAIVLIISTTYFLLIQRRQSSEER
jgi:ABC-type sugar transport system permease subunit